MNSSLDLIPNESFIHLIIIFSKKTLTINNSYLLKKVTNFSLNSFINTVMRLNILKICSNSVMILNIN